mgnify:CR=1 FL=1
MQDTITRNCGWCNQSFETTTTTAIYCTRYHKELAKAARRTNFRHIYPRRCNNCDTAYVTTNEAQIYCKQECRWEFKRKRRREIEKKLGTRTQSFKRKLYFRDEGLCGICSEPILLSDKYPHPRSLSIDHIVPLAKGGNHAQYNLQIAHWICNVNKGEKTIGNFIDEA